MKSDKKSTIYDVADKAKVSLATVSRVLNSSSNVRPDTVKRVEKAIASLNYHPDEIARGLVTKKSTTIGILIPNTTDLFFSELMRGINDVSQIYDYNIIYASTDDSFGLNTDELVEKLLMRKVDGLILLADQFNQKIKKSIDDADVPYVLLSELLSTKLKANQVSIDIASAINDSFDYLVNSSSQKVAFLDHRNQQNDHQTLLEIFENQYLKNKLKPIKNSVSLLTGNYFEAGYRAFKNFQEFDAIITSNDQIAAGLLAYAIDNQIAIPNQLQIISLQDSELSTIFRPQISSISFSKYDIGAIGMRMLTKLMNHQELDENKVIIPHQLVLRDSTK